MGKPRGGRKKEVSFQISLPKLHFPVVVIHSLGLGRGKKREGDGLDMPLARMKYGVESLLDLFRLLSKARWIDMYYVCVFQTTAFDYLVRRSIMFSARKKRYSGFRRMYF